MISKGGTRCFTSAADDSSISSSSFSSALFSSFSLHPTRIPVLPSDPWLDKKWACSLSNHCGDNSIHKLNWLSNIPRSGPACTEHLWIKYATRSDPRLFCILDSPLLYNTLYDAGYNIRNWMILISAFQLYTTTNEQFGWQGSYGPFLLRFPP